IQSHDQHQMFMGTLSIEIIKADKCATVASFTQRFDLNISNFTDVTVAANKNAPVRDNPGPGSAMYTHQNGVFAILTCTEVVLRQRQTTDIVTDETGHFKTFFQSFYQPPVFYLNMRHVMNFAAVRVNKPWQDHRNRDQLAQFALV